MYVEDPRFMAYYDKIAPGSAVFLRDAVWPGRDSRLPGHVPSQKS